ncbi:MAG: hypothetical protein MUC56_16205 [Thermoanaerobaculales bacterium]|jgi:hypothetical protein|nr:hypothetical protein [Thermoanaerobaculales bacterium]
MNHRAILAAALGVLALLAPGCSDNEIDFPTGNGGWQIGLTLGVIPPRVGDVPVLVSIRADVINLTDGRRPADGAAVAFSSSGGAFPNGEPEIELVTSAGHAITELLIALPGTYRVEVAYPDESCTAAAEFTIGLE